MANKSSSGSPQGGSRGMGQGGRRSGGRRDGSGSTAPGNCICPKCGQKKPHERGVPCFEQTCDQCGTAMVRE